MTEELKAAYDAMLRAEAHSTEMMRVYLRTLNRSGGKWEFKHPISADRIEKASANWQSFADRRAVEATEALMHLAALFSASATFYAEAVHNGLREEQGLPLEPEKGG